MITLNLTIDEITLLTDVLESNLSDLYTEIIHTDNYHYRDTLKDRKEALKRLLHTLQETCETA